MPRHLYLHIPFCHRVCPYCSFYKHTPGNTDMKRFVAALLKELTLRSAEAPLQPETLYFGGGTPTALSETHLATLLEGLHQQLDLSRLQEFTMEANPRTVPLSKARLMRDHGVHRVSLGVQAWDEDTLRTLGRDHQPEEARTTYHNLRRAGFESVNLDLMFSIPGQTFEQWQDSLQCSLELEPDHLSAYNLNYEEDTEYFRRLQAGTYRESQETDARFYHHAHERLTAAGFDHYEISNYARPGHQSRHNAAYWFGADYLGIGPGCTSTVKGRRWQNLRDTEGYINAIEAGTLPETDQELLSVEDRRTERFGLELRTARGLASDQVAESQQGLLAQLEQDGLLRIDEGHIILTPEGQPLVDSIAVALLG